MHRQSTYLFDFFKYLAHSRDFRTNETHSSVIEEAATCSERIFKKFLNRGFLEHLSRKFKFHKSDKNDGYFT